MSTEIVTRPGREIRTVEDNGPLAHLFDTARFEHMFRIASAMAAAALIPEHLRGIRKSGNFTPFSQEEVKANCFLVVNQSLRWGMDPFAVAPETYVVGGKLAYQGKLVAAVINARAGLQGRLSYRFGGEKGKDSFEIIVSGVFPGDTAPQEITLSVGDAKTENQMWRKDPEQKLVYSGAVKWARRYCPEIVLGVVTDDDLERINESAAKTATASEVRREPVNRFANKPDFSTAAEPEKTQEEGGENVAPASGADVAATAEEAPAPSSELDKAQNEGAGESRKPEPPPFVAETPQEQIALALRDIGIAQGPFVQGLRRVNPESVSRNWTTVSQLTDAIANQILEEGLDGILEAIRAKGVKL